MQPIGLSNPVFLDSMFSGVFSNQADLAPNFAGTLMALTNMLATIPGILVPTLVGIITHGTDGLAPWHTGQIKNTTQRMQ